ncbi:MAG: polysaccharide deacetylase family protein [Pacificimonas sp.]
MTKAAILSLARRLGGFGLAQALTSGRLRILCYHGLWTETDAPFGDRLFMPAAQFEARMNWLASSGFPVLPLGDAVDRLDRNDLPKGATVITIDDGWSSTYTHMLPVLERLNLPATCYVTTYYVEKGGLVANVAINYLTDRAAPQTYDLSGTLPALDGPVIINDPASRDEASARLRAAIDKFSFARKMQALAAIAAQLGFDADAFMTSRQFGLMTPDEVRDAAGRGLDIQLHTHRHRGLGTGVDHLAGEIEDNRARLARMLPPTAPLNQFCYPSGHFDPASEPILKAAGVRSATMVDEGINAPGTNPYRLRRFLDGRSVAQDHVHAYLAGALDLVERVR